MTDIIDILKNAAKMNASTIFIVAGTPVITKMPSGERIIADKKYTQEDCLQAMRKIYQAANERDISKLKELGDDDFSFAIKGAARFRVNAYKQRGSFAAAIRLIPFSMPDNKKLNIPDDILGISKYKNGLVLVTGQANSGKTTTLACIINQINSNEQKHIITLEDPIEYLHKHKKSLISQREIYTDSKEFSVALKSALRQSPEIILLGEMRDCETIETAMTAAETGHLIISSLHTIGTTETVNRIIDSFPTNQQQQIKTQLASSLRMIISQKLIPLKNGGVKPVFDIVEITPAIKNMIRENKIHQIDSHVGSTIKKTSENNIDTALLELFNRGEITKNTLIENVIDKEMINKKIN